jgi:hypothetical protein
MQIFFFAGRKTEGQVSVFLYYVIQYQQQSYLSGKNQVSHLCNETGTAYRIYFNDIRQGKNEKYIS